MREPATHAWNRADMCRQGGAIYFKTAKLSHIIGACRYHDLRQGRKRPRISALLGRLYVARFFSALRLAYGLRTRLWLLSAVNIPMIISGEISARALKNGGFFFTAGLRHRGKVSFFANLSTFPCFELIE